MCHGMVLFTRKAPVDRHVVRPCYMVHPKLLCWLAGWCAVWYIGTFGTSVRSYVHIATHHQPKQHITEA